MCIKNNLGKILPERNAEAFLLHLGLYSKSNLRTTVKVPFGYRHILEDFLHSQSPCPFHAENKQKGGKSQWIL